MKNNNNKITIPQDFSSLSVEQLHLLLSEKTIELDELTATHHTLTQELNWFKEQFNLLRHKKFAKASEKQSAIQPDLFNEGNSDDADDDEQETAETQAISYQRKKPKRKNKNIDTTHLPREQRIIDLSE